MEVFWQCTNKQVLLHHQQKHFSYVLAQTPAVLLTFQTGCKNWSVTAALEYEIAADLVSRHLVLCANKAPVCTGEKRSHLTRPLCRRSEPCFLCLQLSVLGGKEWDEIFLNGNYLAGIRHGGINGWRRSTRLGVFVRCGAEWDGWGSAQHRLARFFAATALFLAKSITNELDRFSPPALPRSFWIYLFSCLSQTILLHVSGYFLLSFFWPLLVYKLFEPIVCV